LAGGEKMTVFKCPKCGHVSNYVILRKIEAWNYEIDVNSGEARDSELIYTKDKYYMCPVCGYVMEDYEKHLEE